MIIKKLREKRGWSQDHLARLAGLSIRTVQRIESGNKASLESLMSLACVLEVEIEELTQNIVVIDKTSSNWEELPLWAKLLFSETYLPLVGIKSRGQYERLEKFFAIVGLLLLMLIPIGSKFGVAGLILLVCAYLWSLPIRVGDAHDIW